VSGNVDVSARYAFRNATHEERLLAYLFNDYDTVARAVMDSNQTVTVTIDFVLLRIHGLVSRITMTNRSARPLNFVGPALCPRAKQRSPFAPCRCPAIDPTTATALMPRPHRVENSADLSRRAVEALEARAPPRRYCEPQISGSTA